MHTLRFVFALHNHQPIGNFDDVFEAVYRDSYLPFLDLLDNYPQLPVSMHISGCLMEWLADRHPDYVARLRELVTAGRLEIMGGGFYEPILTMIPSWDRLGQIQLYTNYLRELLGCAIRGMWIPERVWEQYLVRDLVDAGVEYTVLDDFHFRCAGLNEEQLYGYYLTEEEGRLLKVFPNSERLRYLVPWKEPEQTIAYLRELAERHPDVLLVCADDGEKFGGWPGTHRHVFEQGWLRRLFDALTSQGDWLQLLTFSQAVDQTPPVGTIYLPDASYREMTEWALPSQRQREYQELTRSMESDPRWPAVRSFVRGGFWRNFKVKYPETHQMYCRMLEISRRLRQLCAGQEPSGPGASRRYGRDRRSATSEPAAPEPTWLDEARQDLYRAQCNCSYWHGAFGGIYLPHLRHAVFSHLIRAENALERSVRGGTRWVEATSADFNLDARIELRLANNRLAAYLAPARGGQLYELDLRHPPLNLLATLTRRPETYHASLQQAGVAVPPDQLPPKQSGLDQRILYDPYPRRSLIDHFYHPQTTVDDLAGCRAIEHGDFADGVYQARLRRSPERVQAVLTRQGQVGRFAVKLTKSVTLAREAAALEIRYRLEELPPDFPFLFAVELAFAGLAGNAPDRFYYSASDSNLGQLDTQLHLQHTDLIGLLDTWLGVDLAVGLSRPAGVWTFPIQTVSRSEGGAELVYQSSTVVPYWTVQPNAKGQWSVTLTLSMDTSGALTKSQTAAIA